VSHSADIIIYDAIDCPVLYRGSTAVLPIEGVYEVIEVESQLSRAALLEDMKIEAFNQGSHGTDSLDCGRCGFPLALGIMRNEISWG
jgi:hypothetical protein